MEPEWMALPAEPSPLVVARASKQLSVEFAIPRATRTPPISQGGLDRYGRITLHFPPKGKTRNNAKNLGYKRKIHTIVEPLKGSDAPGDKAAIHYVLARSEPRRIKHDRRYTWVEEFLVLWGTETCTFGEVLGQYRLGFDITSITSPEKIIPSHSLLRFHINRI